MKRQFYLLAGLASLALGSIGILLPLLPTVPFMILAAFCFANSSPRLEAWLVEHRSLRSPYQELAEPARDHPAGQMGGDGRLRGQYV